MTTKAVSFKSYHRWGLGNDLEYLTQNLGLLLSAGVDVVSALASVEEGMKSKQMRVIVRSMREQIEQGTQLSKVFEQTGLFPGRVIALVRIGEESGQLAEHFKMTGIQEEKQRSLRGKIRSALLYPVFVLMITLIVGVGVAWFILPKLAKVFASLHLTLPLITKIVLGFGEFLARDGLIAVPLFFVVLVGAIFFLFFFPRTRVIGEYILASLPGVRTLIQEIELTRLGFVLGGLLTSGVPILESLHSLSEATDLVRYRRFYLYLEREIGQGTSLRSAAGHSAYGHRKQVRNPRGGTSANWSSL